MFSIFALALRRGVPYVAEIYSTAYFDLAEEFYKILLKNHQQVFLYRLTVTASESDVELIRCSDPASMLVVRL